jgi:hypothetical protein
LIVLEVCSLTESSSPYFILSFHMFSW